MTLHNSWQLQGRLGKDPEIQYFDSGKCKATCSIAVKTFKKDESTGKYKSEWFDVQIWGKAAEILADHAKKGSLVRFGGRAEVEHWEDKETGKKRSKVIMAADECDPFLNGGDD